MICIRSPRKTTLRWGIVPTVVGLAFLAMKTTAHAYGSITGPVEATSSLNATPLQQARGDSELPWLFAVYIITWAAFFGYAFVMSRRQRELRREIDILQRVYAERERRAASGDSE